MLAQFAYSRQNYFRGFIFSVFFFFSFCVLSPAFSQKRKSAFSASLVNIESATKDPFRYNTSLYNGTGRLQVYQLRAQIPDGWQGIFRTLGSQVSAVQLDADKSQDISLEITAKSATKPGKYSIPVIAISDSDTLRLELEAIVKGSYGIELTTPTGRLSDDVTEGSNKQLLLVVKNTGSLPLAGVEFSTQSPMQWNTAFQPAKIERLDPGQTVEVNATLSVPDKTIAGDYVTTFTAKTNYSSSSAAFRITVKTSLLSGWIGILVILLAVGMVYYLIRKYGRR